MSPILEADVLSEELELDAQILPKSECSGGGADFSAPTFAETAGMMAGDLHARPFEFPAPDDGYFPPSVDLPPDQTPIDASLRKTGNLRPLPARASPSPGTALVEEFDDLYHKYERRVYRQCYRMLGNQEDAEDMVQEVFLQIFRKAHTFRGESNFSTWLHRLTVNTVLMQLRRHRRWRDSVTSLDVAPGADEGMNDVLGMVSLLAAPSTNNLDRIGLDVAIAQLSSGYQEIFLLHDLEGYRHDEIARLLGISEGTSKSQLHKARLRLRTLMGSHSRRSASPSSVRTGSDRRRNRCGCLLGQTPKPAASKQGRERPANLRKFIGSGPVSEGEADAGRGQGAGA